MRELPPCAVSFVPFTSFPQLNAPRDFNNSFGNISKDGMWSWIACDSLLEVFSVQTKERCSVYNFGAKLKNSLSIAAIKEFSSPYLRFPCLIIGLDTPSDCGLLCIYNVKTSKVISAIKLPYKVTSLEIVSSIGGATMETHTLNKQLRYLFGIVAVGTEGGNILLLDLCLDSEDYSDEVTPSEAIFIDSTLQNLPARREVAASKNQHMYIHLNEDNFSSGTFEYRNNGSLLARFPSEDVIVSTLKYIRSLTSIVVGFNFGGIQLWSLQHLTLDISIPIHTSQQPLVQFAFQEPENDPRNFCYLWAIRGHHQGENYRPENISLATLYSFSYAKKEWIPRYGFFYQDLESCTKKFEYVLTGDPYYPSNHCKTYCSRLITCEVISQSECLARLGTEEQFQNEEWDYSEDLSLCLLSWENWPSSGSKPESSYLAVFDINQWYQAQMPSIARCNYGDMCSYLGIFSLQEVALKMDSNSIMALSFVPNSLNRFKSSKLPEHSTPEETFFPSSLSFKIWCLSLNGIIQATYLGSQKQLLAEISATGPNILLDPKSIYHRCLSVGLFSSLPISASKKQVAVARQRETLLTLTLEHGMIQFITACIQSWKHTEFSHTGCSVKFLLEWVWKIITQIKTSIDKLCLPLFNFSVQKLQENSLLTLHIYKSRLKYLSDIICALQSLTIPQTEQGQLELQLRKEAVDSISVYLHVLLWLYDCKLLPEHAEGEEFGEDEVAYPVSYFTNSYANRRKELQKIHSSIGDKDLLLIDGLTEEFGSALANMWEAKGGHRNYPPPSIYAAASSYLITEVVLSKRHMLMYYLILDIIAYIAHHQSHLIERLTLFCSSNGANSGVSKLTRAFWHLDHRDFETALTIFMDPIILDMDIAAWQHVRIVKSLLFQGQPQKALKYINVRRPPVFTEEEIKLHLSVFLANGLIADAFSFIRRHQNDLNIEDLLAHLFLGCQETRFLDTLFQLPLNSVENSALSKFLHSCGDPKAPELLVIFYLLRNQPLEAASLNDKLISQVMERSTKSRERAAARNALVDGFLQSLPNEQKKFAQEFDHLCLQRETSEVTFRRLSTNINRQSISCISYADILNDIMEKFDEEQNEARAFPQTPFRKFKRSISTTPFICPAITPQSRKRLRESEIGGSISMGQTPVRFEQDFTPAKKLRMSGYSEFSFGDTERRQTKSPFHANVLSLLQTPPIARVQSSRVQVTTNGTPVSEVVSILKRRALNERTYSPQISPCATTPSVFSEGSKDDEMSGTESEVNKEDDHPSRHLRFQDLSPEEPQYNSISKPTPRAPIHKDLLSTTVSILEQDLSVGQDDVFVSGYDLKPVSFQRESVETVSNVVEEEVKEDDERIDAAYTVENFTLHYSDSEAESKDTITSESSYSKPTAEELANQTSETDEIGDFMTPNASFTSFREDLKSPSKPIESLDLYVKRDYVHRSPKIDTPFFELPAEIFQVHYKPSVDEEVNMPYIDVEMPEEDVNTPLEKEDSTSSFPFKCTQSKCSSPARSTSEDMSNISIPKSDSSSAIEAAESHTTSAVSVDSEMDAANTEPQSGSCFSTPDKTIVKEDSSSDGSPYQGTRSRSRSESVSPSRVSTRTLRIDLLPNLTLSSARETLFKPDEKPTSAFAEIGNSKTEASPGSPEPTRATEDSSGSSSPYLGTRLRSRSSSASPSRVSRIALGADIPPSIALFTAATETKPTADENLLAGDGVVPSLEAELPHPGTTVPDFKQLLEATASPFLGTRSKSVSPSRKTKHMSITHFANISPVIETEKHAENASATDFQERQMEPCKVSTPCTSSPVSATESKPALEELAKLDTEDVDVEEEVAAKSFLRVPPKDETTPKSRPEKSFKAPGTSKDNTLLVPSETRSKQSTRKKDESKQKSASSIKVKTIKKKKTGKTNKVLEFSFSEPHSPASSQILQALSESPSVPVASFVFSPPVTRTRARQKKMNDTLNMSSMLDVSVSSTKQAQIDPLLQDESGDHDFSDVSVKSTRHSKNTRRNVDSTLDSSSQRKYLNLISPIDPNAEDDQKMSRPLPATQHKMVLRRLKKSVKLF